MDQRQQFIEQLKLQDRLNCMVEPKWLFANFPWSRAIRVECAELTDHLGWKWWKKQEPNYPQAKIELVDIWHFILSHTLIGTSGNHQDAASHIVENLKWPRKEVMNVLGKSFTLDGLTLHESVDMLSAFASAGYSFPALVGNIMTGIGMDWDELHRLYMGKNVLNIFRQQNGYKDGTYVKEWFGSEDNVFLENAMATYPDETADELLARLGFAYAEVKKGAMD